MKIKLNHSALNGLDSAARNAAMFKAIAFHIALPALFADAFGEKLAYMRSFAEGGAGIKQLAGSVTRVPELKDFQSMLARKYATPDQNPTLTDPAMKVEAWFHDNLPELDLAWMALFDLVDLRGSNQSEFDINTTSAGITWAQRQPGAPADIRRQFAESNLPVPYLEFAAGVGILDAWLQFNKFWKVDEVVAEFIATAADKRAAIHYGLFTALGSGIDQAFATDDTTTFNNAAAAILRALRTSGQPVGSNAQFDIVTSPEKVGRILAMLDAKRGSPMIAFGTQDQPIAYSVRNVISTTYVPSNDTGYYLVLPGRKIKRGVWKDPTLESKRDIAVSAQDWVGVEQYNAAIGNSDQVRRVKFA